MLDAQFLYRHDVVTSSSTSTTWLAKYPLVPLYACLQTTAWFIVKLTLPKTTLSYNKISYVYRHGLNFWGMRFNPSKCYIMHISRGQPSTKLYEFCSVILQSVPSAKYLGVTIRSDLQWCEHVNNIAARANSTLHFIHRNLKYCPQSTRETAYCSLVRSTLEYCCGTWDPHLQKDIPKTTWRSNEHTARSTKALKSFNHTITF